MIKTKKFLEQRKLNLTPRVGWRDKNYHAWLLHLKLYNFLKEIHKETDVVRPPDDDIHWAVR